MSDYHKEFWEEVISEAADEVGVSLTSEQIATMAGHVQRAHDNYGMAFYTPPSSDRLAVIAAEHEAAIEKMQREFDDYQRRALVALRKALHQYDDTSLSIDEDGSVYRHGGRTDRIL